MVGQNQLTHSTFIGVVSAVARVEDGAGNSVYGEVSATPTANTVLDRLKTIYTQLVSLVAKDFATQTTLSALNGKDFATQTTLSALNGKDFATQTTLSALNGKDFATQTTLSALNGKDFATETTQKKTRYGRDVALSWIYGTEVTTPAADAALVTKAVTAGKTGYVYGFMITAQEANSFKIKWTSGTVAKTFRIHFAGAGTIAFTDPSSIFEGISADASSNITINNVTLGAGTAVYQAALLYGEV